MLNILWLLERRSSAAAGTWNLSIPGIPNGALGTEGCILDTPKWAPGVGGVHPQPCHGWEMLVLGYPQPDLCSPQHIPESPDVPKPPRSSHPAVIPAWSSQSGHRIQLEECGSDFFPHYFDFLTTTNKQRGPSASKSHF